MTDTDDKDQPKKDTPSELEGADATPTARPEAGPQEPTPEGQAALKGKEADTEAQRQAPEPSKSDKGKGGSKGPKAPKPRKTKQPSRSRFPLALLVLILILAAAIGYGAWLAWEWVEQQDAQWQQQLEHQDEQLQAQANQVNQLGQRLTEQSQTLEQQAQALDRLSNLENLERDIRRSVQQEHREQNQLLENMEQRVNQVNRRLEAIATTDREDWKLAEAEYLLRIANQRLVLERDTRNALALAQTADEILRELDDSDLLPVRRALTRDIQALRLAGRVDREGLYLQLQALQEQVPQLPMVEPLEAQGLGPSRAPAGEDADDTEPEEATGAWNRVKQSFNNILQRLSNHIRIRRHDEPIMAMADPREQFFLRQRLQLMLEQAQAALLREEADIYRTSLTRAGEWLETHYRMNPRTREVIATLDELAEAEVAPELPDLNQALNLLEQHIRQLQRQSPAFQSPRGGEEPEQ